MSKRCAGKTKAGRPCKAYAVKDSDFCQAHAPELAAERAAWRKSGGEATVTPDGTPIKVKSIEEVLEQAWANLGSTWKQKNTGERTRGINSTLTLILKAFEIGELADRVEALEQRLDDLKKSGGIIS